MPLVACRGSGVGVTYGDSMLFLKCVTDKGGSERTEILKCSFVLLLKTTSTSQTHGWIRRQWTPGTQRHLTGLMVCACFSSCFVSFSVSLQLFCV